jgi:hypothetical protein
MQLMKRKRIDGAIFTAKTLLQSSNSSAGMSRATVRARLHKPLF